MAEWTIEKLGIMLETHIATQEMIEGAMAKDIDLLKKKLLVGNGELSLIEQVHKNTDDLAEIDKALNDGKPNRIQVIDDLAQWVDGEKKFAWIVLALLASEAVGVALILVKHVF